ncbi:MAG TPA: exodeoxyribonuclease VII small subunit [Candidatus Competibacteraceae bacterium]|nr:exodeoxyribonuclease VII small subunit [Candidatus Competibacteraceae bacterium]
MAAKKSPPALDVEQSLQTLEQLVSELERGELSLEQALAHFEQGITLVRQCQQALAQAEQRVEQLVARNGEWITTPLPEQD